MTIRSQNFKVYSGDTAILFVALTQADGTPYDPSLNADLKWVMARTAFSDTFLIEKETGGAGIDIVDGGINITLESADTEFDAGVYYHELKVMDGDDVATAMTGFVIIRPALRLSDVPETDRTIGIFTGHAPIVS